MYNSIGTRIGIEIKSIANTRIIILPRLNFGTKSNTNGRNTLNPMYTNTVLNMYIKISVISNAKYFAALSFIILLLTTSTPRHKAG
jgi:hypothetical protein